MSPNTLEEEKDLAVALCAHGVRLLSLPEEPGPEPGPSVPDVPALAARLASTSSPLLRACLPVLLIAQADRAEEFRSAARGLASEDARRFRVLYTMSVCLQRLWWTRLRLFAPTMLRLEDAYSAELGLPDPERMYGRACRSALDAGLVQDCERVFAIFLEEREREHRLASAAGGRE